MAIEEPFGLEDDGQARVAMLGMPVTVRAYIPDDDRAPGVRARIEEGSGISVGSMWAAYRG